MPKKLIRRPATAPRVGVDKETMRLLVPEAQRTVVSALAKRARSRPRTRS